MSVCNASTGEKNSECVEEILNTPSFLSSHFSALYNPIPKSNYCASFLATAHGWSAYKSFMGFDVLSLKRHRWGRFHRFVFILVSRTSLLNLSTQSDPALLSPESKPLSLPLAAFHRWKGELIVEEHILQTQGQEELIYESLLPEAAM